MQLKDVYEFLGIILLFAGLGLAFGVMWPAVISCGIVFIAMGNTGESKT